MRSTLRGCTSGIVFSLLFVAPAASIAAQSQDWKPFTNTTDGFSVMFPADPEVSKNSVPVGGNTFELHSYVAEDGGTALYVGVCDYGAKAAGADPQTLLASARSGAVTSMNAHILNEKKISLGSNAGLGFEAESDKFHFTTRMYITGPVLYQVMVATPLAETFADTGRFLDSFQITPRPPTEASAVPAIKPAEWKQYPYPGDGFSASFPSQPHLEKQNLATDAGNIEFRTYTVDDSPATLIAGVCDFGPSASGKDANAILQGAKNGAVANIKGRLVSEKPILLDANHGIAFEADNDSAHVSARIYLVGTMLYQMLVATPLNSNYADTARFMDSFHLTDQPAR